MRRLLVFLVIAVALLAADAGFNWWVDPFGGVYKSGALRDAKADGCLVSQELVGINYMPFKEELFRERPTRTFVVGSSRVLRIAARPGERTFTNVGMPGIGPRLLLKLFHNLTATGRRETAYVGVEFFWFNPSYREQDLLPDLSWKTRYLLGRPTFKGSFDLVRQAPYVLDDRWKRERFGSSCVIGRTAPGIAWNLDGSRSYTFELDPRLASPFKKTPFDPDLNRIRGGYYANWTGFDENAVREVDRALALAQARGWRVVGFAPPDPTRYVRLFATSPQIGRFWREFGLVMPALFRKHGFAWVDFRDVRSVPCKQTDFVDGWYHTNAACSARIRARLDAAAARPSGK
jgi:hypothetical protein